MFWRRGRSDVSVVLEDWPAVERVDADLDRIHSNELTFVVHPANVGIGEFGGQFDVIKLSVVVQEKPVPIGTAVGALSHDLSVVIHVGEEDGGTTDVLKAQRKVQDETAVIVNEPAVLKIFVV